VQVGVVTGDGLQGFAVAHILRGEFGQKDAVAVLDAVGVDPQSSEHGLGQSLMEGLVDQSGQRGVRALQSHVSWTSVELLRFFNASNFKLAPRLDLERPVVELREAVDEEI
jgi:N-acetylglutamate synthase-like GNAT family acetyltransferase